MYVFVVVEFSSSAKVGSVTAVPPIVKEEKVGAALRVSLAFTVSVIASPTFA